METKYAQKKEIFLQSFKKLLSFQTIGADPACENEMNLCANYLKERLNALGMESKLIDTPKHPLVFGSNCTAGDDKPTLLLYQHYDVQPIDPPLINIDSKIVIKGINNEIWRTKDTLMDNFDV